MTGTRMTEEGEKPRSLNETIDNRATAEGLSSDGNSHTLALSCIQGVPN